MTAIEAINYQKRLENKDHLFGCIFMPHDGTLLRLPFVSGASTPSRENHLLEN
jgi:hypothetical protein